MRILIWLCLAATLAAVLIWFVTEPVMPFAADDPRFQDNGDPARGQLIFAAGDCASCHATPGQKDRLNLGGGLALASPFGTFRAPNISSDAVDGIGRWSTVDLANALIGGVSPRHQHYYPVFPYPSYTGIRLEDIRDLRAYLRTLAPVSGRPPAHDLFFLFRMRRFLGFWKLLFFREGQMQGTVTSDPVLARGRYLVETLGHCAECHSSRNIFGAIKPETRFAGGTDPEGTGFVPNITPSRIGNWSEADISEMLKSGDTPNHGRVGSSMAEVVTNMAMLPQSDRDAIARYIKSLPPRPTPHP
ncbi:cytochrome c [Rhizobium sp. CNPSo 4062]|uniref:c-type cytochrome n=1 Tax=Rhizobium sp. CNPSo 4062 TaxID=3021410 RepID=UPI00254C0FB8|nr:cytochrome c [Rhizobium sp. CNPSo 4062]MDK4702247.1 cytochrome c [Rhizobium sp. CNPSo 4062]